MTKPFTSARLTDALKSAGTGAPGVSSSVAVAASPAPEPEIETVLIDEEAVATMEAVGSRSGRDVVAKVWKLFVGQAPDAVFKLETLATGADPGALAKQAHFLKSMALSAGAARLGAACEQIEQDGKAGRLAEASSLVATLRPVLNDTCAVMNERLATRPAAAAR